MKRLFIGQRVRILWSEGWPELAGQEGVIVGTPMTITSGSTKYKGREGWPVAPKAWGSHNAPRVGNRGGLIFAPISDQLEPIVPEGAAPSEFTTLADLLQSLDASITV